MDDFLCWEVFTTVVKYAVVVFRRVGSGIFFSGVFWCEVLQW